MHKHTLVVIYILRWRFSVLRSRFVSMRLYDNEATKLRKGSFTITRCNCNLKTKNKFSWTRNGANPVNFAQLDPSTGFKSSTVDCTIFFPVSS